MLIFGTTGVVLLALSIGLAGSGALLPGAGKLISSWLPQNEAPKNITNKKLSIKPVITPVIPETTSSSGPAVYVRALDQAAKDLEQQIAKSPHNPALQNQLGLIYMSLGDTKEAEHCFTGSVKLCRAGLESCMASIEKTKAAGKARESATELVKASRLSVELSAAHSNLARLYDLNGDRTKVVAELDQLNKDGILFNGIDTGSSAATGNTPLETKLLTRGELNLRQNRITQAIEDYKAVLKQNPNNATAHERLGLISAMSSDLPEAIDQWETAARLDPKSSSIQNNLGLAYRQVGLKRAAESSFRKALAINPKSEEASLNLGDLLSANGQMGQATSVLREAAENNPTSAKSHNNLATFLALSGNFPEAISAYNRTLQLDPSMASAHYGMGIALLHTKDYQMAIKAFKQALFLNPKMHNAETKIEEAHRLAAHETEAELPFIKTQ